MPSPTGSNSSGTGLLVAKVGALVFAAGALGAVVYLAQSAGEESARRATMQQPASDAHKNKAVPPASPAQLAPAEVPAANAPAAKVPTGKLPTVAAPDVFMPSTKKFEPPPVFLPSTKDGPAPVFLPSTKAGEFVVEPDPAEEVFIPSSKFGPLPIDQLLPAPDVTP